MPRTSRVTWLHYPHLVIAKANGGTSLFLDDEDYEAYLTQLRQMVREHVFKLYAYCLMPHQLRLVLLPNRLLLSRIMQRLHGRHTIRMNKKQERYGHLFQGRFRSIVFASSEVIDVVRSVHLWPVRDGYVRRASSYQYSSHASYLGIASPQLDFLAINEALSCFSGDEEAKRRAFVKFIELASLEKDNLGIDELVPGIGGDEQSSQELIKKAKINHDATRKSSIATLAMRASLMLSISLEQLIGPSRRQDLVMARRLLATAAVIGADRTVTEVAHFLGRDKAQISRLVGQGMDLMQHHEPFLLMYDALKPKGAII